MLIVISNEDYINVCFVLSPTLFIVDPFTLSSKHLTYIFQTAFRWTFLLVFYDLHCLLLKFRTEFKQPSYHVQSH